jgi:hypothetical protein
MPRKGREFEKLVALLEQSLTPQGITVTSPEYFCGKQSSSRREVDISLRSKMGSSPILIIIECRERDGSEDVRWVEEVISKIKDIGADKAVIVSSCGFTEGAMNMAKSNGIEIRTLSEVDPKEFSSWLGIQGIKIIYRKVNFLDTLIQFTKDTPSSFTIPPQINVQDKIFRMKKTGKNVCLHDLWLMGKTNVLYESLKPNEEKKPIPIRLRFDVENDGCQMEGTEGFADIDFIQFFAEIWIEKKIEPFKGRRYKNSSDTLSETVENDIEINGQKKIISIHNIPQKDGMKFSISLRDPEEKVRNE